MNKDLKDLIDSIDSTNKAHSDLESMIKYLKEEVQRLTFTVNEQKKIIQEQSIKLNKQNNSHLPQDVLLLKELVLNQRQEIMKKDKDIEILQQTIADLSSDLEKAENFDEENEELIYAKKTIVQLTEENENSKTQIEVLNEELKQLKKEMELKTHEIKDEDQELIDAKKLIFQLTEETGINKVKIESLRLQNEELQETITEDKDIQEKLSKELEESEKLIDQLTYDNEHLYEKVKDLQQKLEETSKETENKIIVDSEISNIETFQKELNKSKEEILDLKNIINSNINTIDDLQQKNLTLEAKRQKDLEVSQQELSDFSKLVAEKEKELEQLNSRFKKVQNANKQLSDLIVELRTTELKPPNLSNKEIIPKVGFIDQMPPSLFFNMYNQLDESSKNQIIKQLIKDLHHKERDLRIYAIKLLSILKGKNAFEALINLKDDYDWIIKLYLIRALKNFNPSDIENTLKYLQKDKDNDVREAATELLLTFC